MDRLERALPIRANGYWYTRDLKGSVLMRSKRAAGNAAYVFHQTSRRLFNPPAAWPTRVAGLVDRMATVNERESTIYRALSRARTARGFARIWGRFDDYLPNSSAISSQIRARLDLPASGHGCLNPSEPPQEPGVRRAIAGMGPQKRLTHAGTVGPPRLRGRLRELCRRRED